MDATPPHAPRPKLRRLPVGLVALGLLAAGACSGDGWPDWMGLTPPPPPPDRPIEVPTEGFATSDTCRACHAEHYVTWEASYHSRMTQVVSPDTVLADLPDALTSDAPPLALEHKGERFLLERRGDEYWVEMDDPDIDPTQLSAGTPRERVWRQLVIVTGSHHFQAFWFSAGEKRKLSLFLFCYRIDEDAWMPVDSAFLARPDVHRRTDLGRWNLGCQQCHVTQGRTRMGEDGELDTHVAEFGIACEACHGGAEEHVNVNRDPLRRYKQRLGKESDPTVVDPADLKPRLSSQVCGQCHGITELKNAEDYARVNAEGTEFEPGKSLTARREVVREGDQYFWSDGMVRVSGREYNGLVDSPCYRHDDRSKVLGCLSCHRLHHDPTDPEETRSVEEWIDDQLRPGMRTNRACTQCHEGYREEAALTAHTHHPAASSGSECMNCHMPYTTWGLLKSIRSHRIDSPTVAESVDTGRPNACNLCHLDRTLDWSAQHLDEWYGQTPPPLDEDQRRRAASVLWLLTGDAGQRGLMAAAMGWPPARAASGTDWMAPFLAQLLEDPYDAVRFRAGRSLRSLPGFEDLDYDFVGPEGARAAVHREARARWTAGRTSGPPQEALLLGADGDLQRSVYERLLSRRDDRPMVLAE